MDPFAGWFAVHVTRDDARSALPDAPIQQDRLGQWLGAIRRGSAGVLHRLADRLDTYPAPAPTQPLSPAPTVGATREAGVYLAGNAVWDRRGGVQR